MKLVITMSRRYGTLKFDTKSSGKPVKSRLPVFCLYVVYLPDLKQEKFL